MKRIFYDWKDYGSYGGGGRWVLNKQRIYNVILTFVLIVVIVLLLLNVL